MSNALVLFGDGKRSLGEAFKKYEYVQAKYPLILSYNLDNGYDCTDPRVMQVAAKQIRSHAERETHNLHMVNFVGMMDNGKIDEYDPDSFRRMMFVNIYSLFIIAHEMIPLLREFNGRFITIGSNAAELGFTGMSAYCATKHAAHGFVKCMAKELAPDNVPVNIVNPGPFAQVSSKMSQVQVEQFVASGAGSEAEVVQMLASRIPMKRLATNRDLNQTLFALLNHMPRYFTGQAVSLNGGMTMR